MSRELGHGSRDIVERVYAHPGLMRHRADMVDYRAELHEGTAADSLLAPR